MYFLIKAAFSLSFWIDFKKYQSIMAYSWQYNERSSLLCVVIVEISLHCESHRKDCRREKDCSPSLDSELAPQLSLFRPAIA